MNGVKDTGLQTRRVKTVGPSMERRERRTRYNAAVIRQIAGMRILIVDDSPSIVAYFELLLDKWGFNNRKVAHTAHAAMTALLNKGHYDLVLLDDQLPDGDGIDLCRNLKLHKKLYDVPIIMITGEEEGSALHEAFEAGATDYISKPPNEDEMKARITAALRFKRETDMRKIREIKLVRLDHLKNMFVAMAAHDLRNPISTVRGLTEIILNSNEPFEVIESLLQVIQSASQDALDIIDNLLDISIIETGEFKLSRSLVDLGALVDSKVYLQRQLAERKQISIEVSHHGNIPFWFDKVKVGQIIDNLLSNAIKYASYGTMVSVIHDSSDSAERVSVVNRGQGIAAEELGMVFEAFHKTSAIPTGGERSIGLGLAIAKKIIDSHKGSIEVTSEPGEETMFRFTLPRENHHE
jgi:signal transduction histidine kinase